MSKLRTYTTYHCEAPVYLDKFPVNTGLWLSMHIDGKKLFIVGNFTTEEQISSAKVPTGWGEYYNFISTEQLSDVAGKNTNIDPHDFIIYSNFLMN